jgi:hypothetical protein
MAISSERDNKQRSDDHSKNAIQGLYDSQLQNHLSFPSMERFQIRSIEFGTMTFLMCMFVNGTSIEACVSSYPPTCSHIQLRHI